MDTDTQKEEFIESLYRKYYADLKRYSYHCVHNDPKFTPYIEDYSGNLHKSDCQLPNALDASKCDSVAHHDLRQ